MDILKWRATYETGIGEMDDQHKRLIHLVNQMYSALRNKEELESLDAVLAEMKEYAEQHFHDEEEFLLRHGYPGLEAQQTSHREYRQKIKGLEIEKTVDKRAATQDIYSFLRQWWIAHISTDDKEYGIFLKAKGL